MTKYTMLFKELLYEKEKIEEGEKILAERKKEVLAMISEVRKIKRDIRPFCRT
jgi:hypothetical protein